MYPNTAEQNLCGLMQWMVPVVYLVRKRSRPLGGVWKRDMSLAADLADSKEEASNKEEVWKKRISQKVSSFELQRLKERHETTGVVASSM